MSHFETVGLLSVPPLINVNIPAKVSYTAPRNLSRLPDQRRRRSGGGSLRTHAEEHIADGLFVVA